MGVTELIFTMLSNMLFNTKVWCQMMIILTQVEIGWVEVLGLV